MLMHSNEITVAHLMFIILELDTHYLSAWPARYICLTVQFAGEVLMESSSGRGETRCSFIDVPVQNNSVLIWGDHVWVAIPALM